MNEAVQDLSYAEAAALALQRGGLGITQILNGLVHRHTPMPLVITSV